MSKGITFFRNRQQGIGQTYEVEIQDSDRTYRVGIFSRKPLGEALVGTPRQLRGGSITDEVDKITQALRVEGGVIALTYEDNRERILVIIPVSPAGKAAFDNFGLLVPGHPSLRMESVTENGIRFPPGSYALVPVDKDAEESLRGFQSHVGYLPPDLESLVLHAIRDPGLDLRVGRLEAATFKSPPGTVRMKGSAVAGSWYESWLKKPVPVWPMAAVILGLMLAVNSGLLYFNLRSDDGSAEAFNGQGNAGPKESKEPEDQDGGDQDTKKAAPEEKIFAVVEAARSKSSNEHFKNLTEKHFLNVQNAIDVSKMLAPGTDGELLVRGLMKLEASRLGASTAGLFDINDNPSAVYTFYEAQAQGLDQSSRDLLAALNCRVYRSPGLKKRGSNQIIQFAASCEPGNSLDKTIAGLDRLLNHLQGS